MYDRSFSSCPAICKPLVIQTRVFRELRLPFPVFRKLTCVLSCSMRWRLNLITSSSRAFAGLFRDFPNCHNLFGWLRCTFSLRNTVIFKSRSLASPPGSRSHVSLLTRSVTVRDSSHGTFHNHLKTPWAVCAREQICIHLSLCSVSIIGMIYST